MPLESFGLYQMPFRLLGPAIAHRTSTQLLPKLLLLTMSHSAFLLFPLGGVLVGVTLQNVEFQFQACLSYSSHTYLRAKPCF